MPERARRFTTAQWDAITDRGREVAVSASAGTGKTSVLVERIVQRLLGWTPQGFSAGHSSSLERLIVVTFTRKAAAEMRQRLEQRLAEVQADGALEVGTRQLAAQHLKRMPLARIGTIHGFCGEVIDRYGAAAGLRSARQLDENETRLLLHQLANTYLDRKLDGSSAELIELALAWGGPDGVGTEDLTTSSAEDGLRPLMLALLDFKRSLVDPPQWFARARAWADLPGEFEGGHPLCAALLKQLGQWCDTELRRCRALLQLLDAGCPQSKQCVVLRERMRLLEGLRQARTWAQIQSGLVSFRDPIDGRLNALSASESGLSEEHLARRCKRESGSFRRAWDRWQELFAEDWRSVRQREQAVGRHLDALWQLTCDFEGHYSDYKQRHGLRDFADLERQTFLLLAAGSDDGGEASPTAAALALRGSLDEVLIDEYQDTNELQDAILRLVSPRLPTNESETLQRFVVGDLKQSIYGFRLADPHLFQQLCQRLASRSHEQGRHYSLSTNFRSTPAVLHAVNDVFRSVLTEQFGGEDYSRSELQPPGDWDDEPDPAAAYCLASGQGPAAVETEAGDDSDDEQSDQVEPGVVTRCAWRVAQIHRAGRLIRDPEDGSHRPLRWGDIAILLRSTTGLDELREQLERAGIPCSVQGRRGYYERQEVLDALAVLSVIDNPLRDVQLAAVLGGPCGGLGPAELLEVASTTADPSGAEDKGHPWLWSRAHKRAQADDELGLKLRQLLDRVQEWQAAARNLPLTRLVWQVLRESGLLVAAAGKPRGLQRYANLVELAEMARRFAGRSQANLTSFLEFIRHDRRAAGDIGEVPVPGGLPDEVQVMTIHQAKGKEFPVVILPCVQRRFNEKDLRRDVLWNRRAGIGGKYFNLRDEQWVKWPTLASMAVSARKRHEMLEEELRVLYVGLTRARDYVELIMAEDEQALAEAVPVAPAQACSVWDWLVPTFRRPNPHWEQAQAAPVPPQLTAGGSTPVSVDLTAAEQLATAGYAGPGSSPPFKVTVTALTKAAHHAGTVRAVHLEQPEQDGKAHGSIVHQVLQRIVEAGQFSSHCTAEDLGRAWAACTASEIPPPAADLEALRQAVVDAAKELALDGCKIYSELSLGAALSLLELQALAAAELPWTGQWDVLLQGTVDLLVQRTDGSALVIDFKTDRVANPAELLQRYGQQLTAYCALVSRAVDLNHVDWAIYGIGTVGLVGPFSWTKPPAAAAPGPQATPLTG